MADTAGQTNNSKQPQPYYGERKLKTGNLKADQRKLRDMMRASGKKRGTK